MLPFCRANLWFAVIFLSRPVPGCAKETANLSNGFDGTR